jgi:RNA polymerase sigma-70 factor (ECF subfamily)
MTADSESVNLVARWRKGDQQAATELFERYARRLIALAHSRLSSRLSARIDPQDVVQSVYQSFFAAARDGRFVLQRSGDLWRLLVSITLHKVCRKVEYHTAGKRTVRREQPLPERDDVLGIEIEVMGRDPSPDEAVLLTDVLEDVLRGVKPKQRRIVELRLQGYSLGEIVTETQFSTSTVCRVLRDVADQLSRQDLPAPPT